MNFYFDSSALAKAWLLEPETGLVRAARREAVRMATSLITYTEARSAFARVCREGRLTQRELSELVEDFDAFWPEHIHVIVTSSLVRLAGQLAERHALRGFDAIHLSSAIRVRQRFPDGPWTFAVFDKRLQAAAEAEGFALLG